MTEEEEMINLSQHSQASMPSMGTLQLNALMATAIADQSLDDLNAQSILDEHCSQVWDSSAGQSPGRASPKSYSPDRSANRSRLMVGPSPNVSAASYKGHHHKRKDKDAHYSMSMLSFDSGMGEEKTSVHCDPESSRHIHHYYHFHHMPKGQIGGQPRGMPYTTSEPVLRSGMPMPSDIHSQHWEDTPTPRGRSRDMRRSMAKKNSDSSSNIDSGVSLRFENPQPLPTDHTNEK